MEGLKSRQSRPACLLPHPPGRQALAHFLGTPGRVFVGREPGARVPFCGTSSI